MKESAFKPGGQGQHVSVCQCFSLCAPRLDLVNSAKSLVPALGAYLLDEFLKLMAQDFWNELKEKI